MRKSFLIFQEGIYAEPAAAPGNLSNFENRQGFELMYNYDKINLEVFHRNNSLTSYRI